MSDGSTSQIIAGVEGEPGHPYLGELEEEAVNLSLVGFRRGGSVTSPDVQPMCREEEEEEEEEPEEEEEKEEAVHGQRSASAPHASDTAEPTTVDNVQLVPEEEEALEQDRVPSPDDAVEPMPVGVPPRSPRPPISPIGSQASLPAPNGLSEPLPPAAASPLATAAYQPPRADITQAQVRPADMGLSLEQRRAVGWSACHAALEKYPGQQGCNDFVLKMLIDSKAMVEAACAEAAKAQNPTQNVSDNDIASWDSAISEQEDEVDIDDDYEDDCFGSLELAYPD
ncbi:hypothetical protein EST38_g1363 [Candolleomyces aberdarensis]|uniref:Uncharacterized protein n=1 Tax=Candolleomyces aberdarensis TaxID=2316362 RepID=A0A4Q2DXA7_9AGAR|nr:hypothetical protein EST38_g1363 [Candolleomyces aberdarensis]